MNSKQAIQASMDMSLMVFNTYLSDLSDADLMVRPGPGCNHTAWQLGHLIAAEVALLNDVCPGAGAQLPAGFAEKHAKDKAGSDDAGQFHTKQEYLDLFAKVRAATLAALAALPEARLDEPGPERFRQMFPTVGQMLVLIGTHPMMHAGQIAVVRRKLGKPVLI
ncbi:MAG: DinB family protein [Pirellulaceae bacterium]|nr:DinB family protein [Pirellulaceae bacterium]